MRVEAGFLRTVAIAAVALVLSGCNNWLEPGGPGGRRYNPAEDGLTAANVGSLGEAWSASFPATTVTEAVVSGGRTFVLSHDGSTATVRGYDVPSGAALWDRTVTPSAPMIFNASAMFSGNALAVTHPDFSNSTCPAELTRLDLASGAIEASRELNFPHSEVSTDGTMSAWTMSTQCISETAPDMLVVADAATYTTQWTHTFAARAGRPKFADGTISVDSGDQRYTFSAAGCGAPTCEPTSVGPIPVGGLNGRRVSVRTVKTDLGHGVVAESAHLEIFDVGTGALLWSHVYFGANPYQNLGRGVILGTAVDDDTIYVAAWYDTNEPGTAHVLDAFPLAGCGSTHCAPAWRGELSGLAPVPYVTVGGGVVYLGAGAGVLAFDTDGCGATTCSPLATVSVPGGYLHGMSLAESTLFVTSSGSGTGTGYLTAYRAAGQSSLG